MLEVRELPWRDPESLFGYWANDRYVAWLDSGGPTDCRARYSYLGIEPFKVIIAHGDHVEIDGAPVALDPFTALERELEKYRLPPGLAPVPFATGAVGFFSYELGRHLERLPTRHPNDLDIPEMVVAFYDVVFAFDRLEQRLWLLSSGFPATGQDRAAHATERADTILQRLEQPAPVWQNGTLPPLAWQEETPRPLYERQLHHLLEHIRAGNIYQANFTVRHLAQRPADLAAPSIYAALRRAASEPFGAYLGCGDRLTLLSVSPERFLRLDPEGIVETRPIKGTRRRGATAEDDIRLGQELLDSVKDRAENLMIVDLLRNDIGRVAVPGSVAVPDLFRLESFSRVHHLVSQVTGRLNPGTTAIDLLRVTFPGGSITGAPKIRAMEIIDSLEVARRGPYCGSIAWIGTDGALDSNIVIRTLVVTPEQLVAQAGGGIVYDSDPGSEYEEMMLKVSPLLL